MAIQPFVITTTKTSLQVLVDDYLDSCRARGLSQVTIERAYSYGLNQIFLPWCDQNGVSTIDGLTQRVLDRFTATLLRDGGNRGALSPHTVHSYVRTVRQFLSWAQREGETTSGAKPQLPRLPRRVIDVLTRAEIDHLEDAAATERDRLIIRLLADTGIRVSELCAITVHDFGKHHRGALLKVRGKGSKERLVPIRPDLARRLERFMRGRPTDIGTDRIFISRRRTADCDYLPLTRNGVLLMIRALTYRSGITKRVHPHLFRHSFATEALRRGMNPVQLANILGHSGLRMIERTYSHLNADDAYDAVERMFTREV